jgi:hypothetical protein
MKDCSSNEAFPTITFLQGPSLAAALHTCRAQETVVLFSKDCSSNGLFPTITFLQDPSLAAALRTCRAQETVVLYSKRKIVPLTKPSQLSRFFKILRSLLPYPHAVLRKPVPSGKWSHTTKTRSLKNPNYKPETRNPKLKRIAQLTRHSLESEIRNLKFEIDRVLPPHLRLNGKVKASSIGRKDARSRITRGTTSKVNLI